VYNSNIAFDCQILDQQIYQFLVEDLVGVGYTQNSVENVIGDITTASIFDSEHVANGIFVAKQSGVVAGLEFGQTVYSQCAKLLSTTNSTADFSAKFTPVVESGAVVQKGEIIGQASGNVHTLLAAERVILNLFQRMSGIATATRAAKLALADESVKILDTRKTAPGLRIFDKLAVLAGGGSNHRMGLYDMVMIKDNHIDFAGSITQAVAAVRNRKNGVPNLRIEVETRNAAEVAEAVKAEVDVIMFDNLPPKTIRELTKLVPETIETEISGGITVQNIGKYRNLGVNYISVGSLTHSVQAFDITFIEHVI
jgi:nicotinate-nucleotide pyrophosphorylase (carboxylating)